MYTYVLLALLPTLLALPSPMHQPLRIPLTAHKTRQFSEDLGERQDWLKAQGQQMRHKYAAHLGERGQALLKRDRMEKRASGSVTMVDIGIDASYSGQVSIGTPAQNFLLILDTGSADLWVAGEGCDESTCGTSTIYKESSSSTFSNLNEAFDITYGSGQAEGTLATDTVTMAGFTVSNQEFAVVNATTAQLISAPLSGLMGLAWRGVSASGAQPFWEQLASSGAWSDSQMGFYLQRYRGDDSALRVEQSGGEFTMGGLDTSRFTGDVNYISVPAADQDYWRISCQGVSVSNTAVTGVTDRSSAIDTGTTLVGVSTADATAIYALVKGATAMDASSGYEGYWQYPCSTDVESSLQFGGLSYKLSNADFNLGSFTSDTSMCTGAFYEMDLSSSSPLQWIVGASFLKNVYSAFRYNPSAIGFAALSGSAQSVSNGTSVSGTNATTGGGTQGSGGTGSSGNGNGTSSSSSAPSTFDMSLVGMVGFAGVVAALL